MISKVNYELKLEFPVNNYSLFTKVFLLDKLEVIAFFSLSFKPTNLQFSLLESS